MHGLGYILCASSIGQEQGAGKGRLSRGWISPYAKGIWFSVVLKPPFLPQEASKCTLLAAVAVVKAINKIADRGCSTLNGNGFYSKKEIKVIFCIAKMSESSLIFDLVDEIDPEAFVAQSAGSGMGAYSFLAGRSWLAVLVLIPTVFAFDAVRKKQGQPYGWPKEKSERKTLLAAGLVCGTFLFAASAAQQIGITINPSTAKAAFLTAMYVVLVPVFGLFLGRKGSAQLWVSMVIAVAGLYMLCMKNGFGGVETSDWILFSCAVLFSFQIMSIDHFSPLVDGVRLSLIQFIVVAVESSAAALIFETPTLAEYGANFLPVVYCGVMSSGAGYTLQILGQKELNPAIASLIMCLESVFSAIGGWLILHQSLSAREGIGCALIFTAVVLAQLPLGKRAESAA